MLRTRKSSGVVNLINFCDEITGLVDKGRAVDIVYLDFSRVFDAVSHKMLIDKLVMGGMDEQTARGIENWLNGWVPGLVISGTDDGAECTLSKFANDTKLEGVADTPEGCAAIQRALNRLEKWADGNLMEFNKEKCKVLHLGRDSPGTRTSWGPPSWEAARQKRTLGS
ncbi:mitochondrial enolase superfamily member 1 [Grus japonensis]|uniref:Mitochondrial enolase superfamily member 1 n=1 Tax=Grus japonensis TaxID=30415 RepID=A0ABC9VQ26_GRUJA